VKEGAKVGMTDVLDESGRELAVKSVLTPSLGERVIDGTRLVRGLPEGDISIGGKNDMFAAVWQRSSLSEMQMDATEAEAGEGAVVADEVGRLRLALEEEQHRSRELAADLGNLRRRAAREQDLAWHGGRRATLLRLLPVLDTLELALATGSIDPHFYEGIAATFRLFTSALLEVGAEPFDSVGLLFDPALHEAVETVQSAGVEPGTIAREVRRGWRFGNELLRPAHVVVTNVPDDAS
jgi:molecular chaperone GrpE